MFSASTFLCFLPLLALIAAAPVEDLGKRCTFNIATYTDVPKAISSKCLTISTSSAPIHTRYTATD
jgi:hypothetical protein